MVLVNLRDIIFSFVVKYSKAGWPYVFFLIEIYRLTRPAIESDLENSLIDRIK